ncbi:MAG: acetate/propionate family kinase [Geminicoccaceae bacterium]|nr:acetate/propionate family kinase [Geminicoccaceae bacterium]
MSDSILVLNAGSSSLKFAVFGLDTDRRLGERVCRGQVDAIGGDARLLVRPAATPASDGEPVSAPDHASALDAVLEALDRHLSGARLVAAGHRVVHGGRHHVRPVALNPAVLGDLEALVPLAPLHQPHALAAIRALAGLQAELPQVACFDTAFHQSQPEVARRFALPRALADEGVVRYGFHGLSYEYVAGALAEHAGQMPERVVVAHLGHGASMTALKAGRSVATTMGFSALDGLVMARRSGALDPGVILYLMREHGFGHDDLSRLLYEESGLLGVSGISSDMRTLLESDDPRANDAVELFVYRIGRELGSLAAALGGLDALVFTGGIGEGAAPIRAMVSERASWLGVVLDRSANDAGGPSISAPESRTGVWVIPTDEELVIARHTLHVLQA